MKKLISKILVVSMVLSFTMCSMVQADEADDEKVKIGFCCWGYTDAESRTYVRLLDYAGEACGFEPVYTTYTDMDDLINQTETMIQAGCQGIISITASQTQMDLCEDAGVYLCQWASEVTDPEVREYLEQSPYWVGTSLSDNVELAKSLVEKLYDDGCRHLLVAGPSAGNNVHDLRFTGIYEAVDEHDDMEVVAEWRDPDWTSKASDTIGSYLNMYPEIDGIVSTGGSEGACDAIVQAIVNANAIGQVKYACVDVVDNTPEYLEEGSLDACIGFTCTDVVWLAIVMTNLVNGWDAELPVAIHMQACLITSLEDYDAFNTYVQGEEVQPFAAEEYQSITYTLNPDVTVQDVYDLASQTSLEALSSK